MKSNNRSLWPISNSNNKKSLQLGSLFHNPIYATRTSSSLFHFSSLLILYNCVYHEHICAVSSHFLIILQLLGRWYTSLSYSVGHLKWILSNSTSYSFGKEPRRTRISKTPDRKMECFFIFNVEVCFYMTCFFFFFHQFGSFAKAKHRAKEKTRTSPNTSS